MDKQGLVAIAILDYLNENNITFQFVSSLG